MRKSSGRRQRVSSAKRQHRVNARKQRKWRNDALKDARYNDRQAAREQKAGRPIEAKASRREARVDRQWAKKRKGWADKEAKAGK